ncbi:coxsackievirus and adenovirus receptor-like [Maylandia zebra]|uniref:coxsackievirus and adenovirus receptor-like n=1 Tax=Maylandia zebra TaxID=106582 RepID=UPI00403D0F80
MVYRSRESMMNFLRIGLLWALLFVGVLQASVHKDQKNITAGQNVTLPCRGQDNNIPITVVEWSRADLGSEYVLLYRDDLFVPDNQHPSFKNRVDLQDRKMKDGDVSLILKDVTINDTGTYECRVFRRRTNRRKRAHLKTPPISIINLHVVDPPGQTGGHTEDGGKEAGSVGLVIGLSVVAVVLFLIYRKHKQCNQDSHHPPTEPQTEMSESFLNSESPAAEYNDRNDLEANNCHGHSRRIPDVTLTLADSSGNSRTASREKHQSAVDNV